jgi:hypothetical protein
MRETRCGECNAQYSSERELRDHMAMAHRKFGTAQSGFAPLDKEVHVAAAVVDPPPT